MCLCALRYCRLIGKVAADHSHKWVFQEAQEHEINLISSWSNPADSVSVCVSLSTPTDYSQSLNRNTSDDTLTLALLFALRSIRGHGRLSSSLASR
jgi:hypothetical protein